MVISAAANRDNSPGDPHDRYRRQRSVLLARPDFVTSWKHLRIFLTKISQTTYNEFIR